MHTDVYGLVVLLYLHPAGFPTLCKYHTQYFHWSSPHHFTNNPSSLPRKYCQLQNSTFPLEILDQLNHIMVLQGQNFFPCQNIFLISSNIPNQISFCNIMYGLGTSRSFYLCLYLSWYLQPEIETHGCKSQEMGLDNQSRS